jgi:indole-3-glycerol phosphate synthase
MVSAEADLLATIVAATRRIVELRRAREPLEVVMRRVERGLETGDARLASGSGRFRAALQRPDRVNVIAECKRRSPSRGVLRADYDPIALAAAFERAGAAAISVLTEPTFFDGSLQHLRAVSERASIPILRKDFTVDEYQIAEARAMGADAVLLIAAALSDGELSGLLATASRLGLDVLVEVHDALELDRALAAGAESVGVNNRNLRTLAVDTQRSAELIPRIPKDVVAVAESGFTSAAELATLRRAGYHAFLVGEWLMTSSDPAAVLRGLVTPG